MGGTTRDRRLEELLALADEILHREPEAADDLARIVVREAQEKRDNYASETEEHLRYTRLIGRALHIIRRSRLAMRSV